MYEKKDRDNAFSLPKLFDSSNYLAENITMPLSVFYNFLLDKTFKDTYFLTKISEENFNKLFGC
jgi:hypothetical protein